jgi:hypothetical protein
LRYQCEFGFSDTCCHEALSHGFGGGVPPSKVEFLEYDLLLGFCAVPEKA